MKTWLILPTIEDERKVTKSTMLMSEDEIQECISNGYFLVNEENFNKLIGNADKFYKISHIDGSIYEVTPPAPTIDELKTAKLAALKSERDSREVEPIEYNGKPYDYDDKARDRINAAIIALELAGAEATLAWTTADNTNATVTAQDLRNIIAAVAMRSNTLHEQYRVAKEVINAAETKEEVEAITLEGNADG